MTHFYALLLSILVGGAASLIGVSPNAARIEGRGWRCARPVKKLLRLGSAMRTPPLPRGKI